MQAGDLTFRRSGWDRFGDCLVDITREGRQGILAQQDDLLILRFQQLRQVGDNGLVADLHQCPGRGLAYLIRMLLGQQVDQHLPQGQVETDIQVLDDRLFAGPFALTAQPVNDINLNLRFSLLDQFGYLYVECLIREVRREVQRGVPVVLILVLQSFHQQFGALFLVESHQDLQRCLAGLCRARLGCLLQQGVGRFLGGLAIAIGGDPLDQGDIGLVGAGVLHREACLLGCLGEVVQRRGCSYTAEGIKHILTGVLVLTAEQRLEGRFRLLNPLVGDGHDNVAFGLVGTHPNHQSGYERVLRVACADSCQGTCCRAAQFRIVQVTREGVDRLILSDDLELPDDEGLCLTFAHLLERLDVGFRHNGPRALLAFGHHVVGEAAQRIIHMRVAAFARGVDSFHQGEDALFAGGGQVFD